MSSKRTELEQRLNQAVQRNGNQTVLFTNAISQRIGLSATEFECFSLLLDYGPFTAGELALKCGLSSGGATGMINRLENAGFATRTRDPEDKRRVIVSAVKDKKTFAKINALYKPVGDAFDGVVKNYSDAELKTIIDFLDRGNDMIIGVLAGMRE